MDQKIRNHSNLTHRVNDCYKEHQAQQLNVKTNNCDAKNDAFEQQDHRGHSKLIQTKIPIPTEQAFFNAEKSPSLIQQQAQIQWNGPILQKENITEIEEQRFLKEANATLKFFPYGSFDSSKKPLVLVHGIMGCGKDMIDFADQAKKNGQQVFFVFYDDRKTLTSKNGLSLAKALVHLRQNYFITDPNLKIVAHSMGGIVSRAALNYLDNPTWLDRDENFRSLPKNRFSKIELHTVDTPWDGFIHEPNSLTFFIAPIMKFFFSLFGFLGAFDLLGSSRLFKELYKTPRLKGVTIENHTALNVDKKDSIRSLRDLSIKDRISITRFILEGKQTQHIGLQFIFALLSLFIVTNDKRIQNMAMSLTQDHRFRRLKVELQKQLSPMPSNKEASKILIETWEKIMPSFEGTHNNLLVSKSGSPSKLSRYLLES